MFSLIHARGDLFDCAAPDAALAHCVSADLHMGRGIAVLFKSRFQGVEDLLEQKQTVGGCAVLERNNRPVYYLVTKARYFHKPTYSSLRSSLLAMRDKMLARGITKVSMPRIGCGLDRLEWERVEDVLSDVFADTSVTIFVYSK